VLTRSVPAMRGDALKITILEVTYAPGGSLRWAALCPRIALGAPFLSGIADRFGLYHGENVGYGDFAGFERYTAKVNSFMPSSTIPFPAWTATIRNSFSALLYS
jgi:hypothetical protein